MVPAKFQTKLVQAAHNLFLQLPHTPVTLFSGMGNARKHIKAELRLRIDGRGIAQNMPVRQIHKRYDDGGCTDIHCKAVHLARSVAGFHVQQSVFFHNQSHRSVFVRSDGCKGLQDAQAICSIERLGSLGLQPEVPGCVGCSASGRQLANNLFDGGRALHALHSAIGKDSVLFACCGQRNGNIAKAFQAAGKTPAFLQLRIAKYLAFIVIR